MYTKTPRPSAWIRATALSSWRPQSHRREWKTSPVRHSECTRTSTGSSPDTETINRERGTRLSTVVSYAIAHDTSVDSRVPLALVMGSVSGDEPVLVRVHSECLTGDVFHSRRCDCGLQLDKALARIQAEGRGVFVYMRQEGRRSEEH